MATTLQLEHKTTQGEIPKLTVLHHTPDTNVSHVNTAAVCATIAHHDTPHNETPTIVLSLERNTQSTDDETVSLPTLPSLDPDREEDTSAADPTTTSDPVTSCHLNELAAMRRVEEAKTEAKETITDKVILTELETLMTAARDAIEKVERSLAMELTDVNLSRPDATDTEQTTDIPTWYSPLLL